jgi:Protein of unknown function (DUF4231)
LGIGRQNTVRPFDPEALRQDWREIIDSLSLPDPQTRFLVSRWLEYLIWMEKAAQRTRRRYYLLRCLVVVGAVIVPALVSLNVVRVWDPRAGRELREPLTAGTVKSVAFGEVDGEPVILAAGGDAVRLWDARTGQQRAEPLTGHSFVSSVAVGAVDGEPVIVSGDTEGTLRVWNLRGHDPPITAEVGAQINDVALGFAGCIALALDHGVVVLDLATPFST